MEKILKIARMGHPILLQRAKEVGDPASTETQQVIKDMLATMQDIGNNIGLAAPQVHIPLRIMIFKIPKAIANPRYELTPEYDPEGVPLTVLINPNIEPLGDEMIETWESCLSVPGLMAKVARHKSVQYSGITPDGQKLARTAHGFHARAIQHEYDHLEGILYPMRMTSAREFGYQDEILTYVKSKEK